MKEENLLIQPNSVTNARYDYTATQKNIMYFIIEGLQRYLTKEKITGKEIEIIVSLRSLDVNKNYNRLLEEARDMMSKPIRYEKRTQDGKEMRIMTALISGIRHELGSPNVGFVLPSDAVPVFTYIGDGYTKYRKVVALTLRSVYSKRLYEFCCKWEDKGGFNIKMDVFRQSMAIPKGYKNSNIKQRVLEPSKEELKKDGDVYFEYDLVKSSGSKSYDIIRFKVITKKNHNLYNKEKREELYKRMYAHTYRFLSYFVPDNALQIVEELSLSDSLDKASERFDRLDDEYSSGKKKKEDIIRLIKHIVKEDYGLEIQSL